MIWRKVKYDKSLEEPISTTIGYPYSVLPKGYPDRVSDQKIKEVIQKLLENLRANAGVQSIVDLHTTLINLGQNELSNRSNERVSSRAHFISIVSLMVALASLFVSLVQIYKK